MATVASTSMATAAIRMTGSFTRVSKLPTRGMARAMHTISMVV